MALRRFVLLCAVAACAVAEEAKPEGATGENGEKKEEKSKQEIVAQYSYCQEDNCYELLGVSKESKAPAIKRAYRKLAAIWHPDKNPDPRAKELFPKYANAYEVLFNPEMRSNYDYLLAHPQEFPGFFMRYYKPTYMPKSDVRLVTVLTMIFLSTIQYLFKKSTYENQLGAMKRDPKYKDRLKQLMNETSTTPDAKKQLKGFRGDAGTTKGKKVTPKAEALEELKAQAEAKLDGQLQQEGKIPSPPLLADTVAVAFFKLPLTLTYAIFFHGGWFVSHTLLGKDFSDDEKSYLTRRALGCTEAEWNTYDDAEAADLLGRELWVSDNLAAWDAEIAAANKGASKSNKEIRAARQKKKGIVDGGVHMLE